MLKKEISAETGLEVSTNADGKSVSQTIAKPIVGSSTFQFRAWNVIVHRMQHFTLEDIEKQKGNIQWQCLHITLPIGRKDKNGNEIYEGDFVKSENQADTTQLISIDTFHGMRIMIGKNQFTKADGLYGEVVGNIFQNPELLG